MPCLLLLLALLVDGADHLRIQNRADALASEAGRAALTALDTRGAALALDNHAAVQAAHRYLHATGHTAAITITGPTSVHVHLDHSEPAALALLERSHHVTAEATTTVHLHDPARP